MSKHITDAARELGRTLNERDRKKGVIRGTVTDIRGLEDRDIVEVQLEHGEYINAIAHVQTDVEVGMTVYVEPMRGGNRQQYVIVTLAGRARGETEDKRDPDGIIKLYADDKPLSPRRLPKAKLTLANDGSYLRRSVENGQGVLFNNRSYVLLKHAQAYVKMRNTSYLRMKVQLKLREPFATGRADQIQYWLFGFVDGDDDGDEITDELHGPPDWAWPLTQISNGGKRVYETIDLTSEYNDWLNDQRRVLFVLALVRLDTDENLKLANVGRIARAVIRFRQEET